MYNATVLQLYCLTELVHLKKKSPNTFTQRVGMGKINESISEKEK